jgi:hypothetical protein
MYGVRSNDYMHLGKPRIAFALTKVSNEAGVIREPTNALPDSWFSILKRVQFPPSPLRADAASCITHHEDKIGAVE